MSERAQRVTLEWTLAGRTALLLALCGLAVTVPFGSGLALLPALILAAFVVSGPLAWLTLRRVHARAEAKRSVRAGQRFEFPLVLGSKHRGLVARDLIVHSGGDGPASSRPLALVARLAPAPSPAESLALASTNCEWRTRRRGPIHKLALRVASEHPLGMWRATARFELEVDWLSLPQPAALKFDPVRRTIRRREHSLDTRSRRGDEEFYALRDARPGDSPHRIHWRSSARRGKTVVREMRGEEQPEAKVVLVGWVEHAPAAGRLHEGFERAVSLAAAVAERRARAGEATLVCFDGPRAWSLRVSAGRGSVQSLMARLALVECGEHSGGLSALRSAVQASLSEGAFVIGAWPGAREMGRVLQRAEGGAAVLVAAPVRASAGARA